MNDRILCALMLLVAPALAAGPLAGRGIVIDAHSGRPLQGALVRARAASHPGDVPDVPAAVSTTSSGSFSIALPERACSLIVVLAGYSTAQVPCAGWPDSVVEIRLTPVLYALDEIVVQASRLRLGMSSVPAHVAVFDRLEMDRSPVTSLAGLLGTAPGLFVKDYGGGSGLKTLSQRGLGAEHTAILLNGITVNSPQNGIVDLGIMPLENLERVEVLHGGASLSFGSQAIGGVVNLVSRAPASEPVIRAGAMLGSYGYERYSLAAGTNVDGGAFRIGYLQEGADDDFRFIYHDGPNSTELRRSNSDFLARSVTFKGALAAGVSTIVDAFATGLSAERGVAGVVVSPASAGSARQSDTEFLAQVGVRHSMAEDGLLDVRGQGRIGTQRYSDPSIVIAGEPIDNRYTNRELRLEPRYEGNSGGWLKYAGGALVAAYSASGDVAGGSAARTDWGMYAQARASITSPLPSMEEAYVIGGVRHDRAGAVSASSPSVGAGLRTVRFQAGPMMDASFSLRGSLNRSFRAPTFNELYYSGGGGQGNSDLQPEYSSGLEAGGTFAFVLGGDHAIDVSLFSTRMEGRIVWSPAGQGIVMPKNLRQVDSDGYEASYTLDLFDRMLRARAYYGNARAVNAAAAYPGDPLEGKSLVYVPVETGGATLSFVHRLTAGPVTSVGGTLWYAITGPRFMTEDNLESLPMYDVLDLALSVGMAWWGANVGVRCEVHNILNEDYQCIRGYPMPLRTVRLGLAIDY